jgi:NAD(P)-dependent dehydrogenase (short-subunit alcohol dehydrogenase family)
MDIQGKRAVVTGGGSGIGRATALRLAAGGAAVVVADIDAPGVRQTVADIERAGGVAVALPTDVRDADAVHRMIAGAEERVGGLDILYNNAGVITLDGDFSTTPAAQWQRVLDVNLRAVILATQMAIPALRRRGGGVIINTSSLAAFVGYSNDPVYAATKAGVVLFTQSLAYLAAEGIRVNCVCPGLVDTPMLRRATEGQRLAWLDGAPMLQPDDIAAAVVELVADDAVAGRALRIAPGMRDFAPFPLGAGG